VVSDLQEALGCLVDGGDLDRLDALLSRFNIFTAVGMVGQEIRHSALLAFLLDPRQPHGLGDAFLRAFLHEALSDAGVQGLALTPGDLAICDLSDATVDREWQRIDILVRSAKSRLVVVIENKVWAGEHGDQLERYGRAVAAFHPGWHILHVYLTPGGHPASDARYRPISYKALVTRIEELLRRRGDRLDTDVATLLRHYVDMVRREIVGDTEAERLAQDIYRQHKRAIDFILAHRPDHQAVIRDLAEQLVLETEGLLLDFSRKSEPRWIAFLPSSWDAHLPRGKADLSPERRILTFFFSNLEDRLLLQLSLRPGAVQDRQPFFDGALANAPLLMADPPTLAAKYIDLYRRDLLVASDYEGASSETLEATIRAGWADFLAVDLPLIETIYLKVMGAG